MEYSQAYEDRNTSVTRVYYEDRVELLNKFGQVTLSTLNDGFSILREYNEKGFEMLYKTSDGVTANHFYDDNDNLIRTEISTGSEYRYDLNGNCIYQKLSNDHIIWNIYDINNKMIYHRERCNGEEKINIYDPDTHELIHSITRDIGCEK